MQDTCRHDRHCGIPADHRLLECWRRHRAHDCQPRHCWYVALSYASSEPHVLVSLQRSICCDMFKMLLKGHSQELMVRKVVALISHAFQCPVGRTHGQAYVMTVTAGCSISS